MEEEAEAGKLSFPPVAKKPARKYIHMCMV